MKVTRALALRCAVVPTLYSSVVIYCGYGSGSGSYFGKVLVPVPAPVLLPALVPVPVQYPFLLSTVFKKQKKIY